MPSKKTAGLFLALSLLTTLLTAIFMLLAPLPARYLHLNFGRRSYWSFSLFSTLALYFVRPEWALAQAVVLFLIGLYTELELQKVPRFYSAASAIVISGLSLFFSLAVWARFHQMGLAQMLRNHLADTVANLQKMRDIPLELGTDQLLAMAPAMVALVLMLLLFFSIIFVKPALSREKATAFRVPDYLVWVLIGSLAGTFLLDSAALFYLQKTCMNLLFISSAAFYFQGLAVLGFFLQRVRVNYFLKAGVFFLLAFHLFIFVAAFGLSDVWFDYRSKLYKNLVKNNSHPGE